MEAKLIVIGGKANKSEVELKLPTTIGRSRSADLTVAHPKVSRQHCQIFERDGLLVVRDNGSLNGTYVDNERITEAILKPGDKLTVGPLTFVAAYQAAGALPMLPARETVVPMTADDKSEKSTRIAQLTEFGADADLETPVHKLRLKPALPAAAEIPGFSSLDKGGPDEELKLPGDAVPEAPPAAVPTAAAAADGMDISWLEESDGSPADEAEPSARPSNATIDAPSPTLMLEPTPALEPVPFNPAIVKPSKIEPSSFERTIQDEVPGDEFAWLNQSPPAPLDMVETIPEQVESEPPAAPPMSGGVGLSATSAPLNEPARQASAPIAEESIADELIAAVLPVEDEPAIADEPDAAELDFGEPKAAASAAELPQEPSRDPHAPAKAKKGWWRLGDKTTDAKKPAAAQPASNQNRAVATTPAVAAPVIAEQAQPSSSPPAPEPAATDESPAFFAPPAEETASADHNADNGEIDTFFKSLG